MKTQVQSRRPDVYRLKRASRGAEAHLIPFKTSLQIVHQVFSAA